MGCLDGCADEFPIALLMNKARRWVLGVDAGEVTMLRAIATCVDEQQGKTVAQLAQDRVALGLAALDALDGPVPIGGTSEIDRELAALVRAARGLLQSSRVHREGVVVDLSAERNVEPEAIAAIFRELF